MLFLCVAHIPFLYSGNHAHLCRAENMFNGIVRQPEGHFILPEQNIWWPHNTKIYPEYCMTQKNCAGATLSSTNCGRSSFQVAQSPKAFLLPFKDLVNRYVQTECKSRQFFPIYACAGLGIPISIYYALQRFNIKHSSSIGIALAVLSGIFACKQIYTGNGFSQHAQKHVSGFQSWLKDLDPKTDKPECPYLTWLYVPAHMNNSVAIPQMPVAEHNARTFELYSGIQPGASSERISQSMRQDFEDAFNTMSKGSNRMNACALLFGSCAAAAYLSRLYIKESAPVF
jgi:hypothetical protein